MLCPWLGLQTARLLWPLLAGTAGQGYSRLLTSSASSKPALAGIPGVLGEDSKYHRVKLTCSSSPAAPINHLAKADKIILAESVSRWCWCPIFWLCWQAEFLAKHPVRCLFVCYSLLPQRNDPGRGRGVLLWMHRWAKQYLFVMLEYCCIGQKKYAAKLWKAFLVS